MCARFISTHSGMDIRPHHIPRRHCLVLSWITLLPTAAITFCLVNLHRPIHPTEKSQDNPLRSRRSIFQCLSIWIRSLAVAGLGLWVWSDVKSFGVQRECTPQTFVVIFGHSVAVTNGKLKVFALLLYGAGGFSTIISPMLYLLLSKRLQATLSKFLSRAASNSQAPGTESLSKVFPNLSVQVLATMNTTVGLIMYLSIKYFWLAAPKFWYRGAKGLCFPASRSGLSDSL